MLVEPDWAFNVDELPLAALVCDGGTAAAVALPRAVEQLVEACLASDAVNHRWRRASSADGRCRHSRIIAALRKAFA